jgi:hypothetical protein
LKKTSQFIILFNKKISFVTKRRKSFLLFIVIPLLILSSCEDAEETGLNLLPSEDVINTVFTDTTTVSTTTVTEDSIRADELSAQLIGCDYSTTFGLSLANVFTQVNLEGTPTFGVLPVADSLVLLLTYSGYYGDTTGLQTVDVYRLTEEMIVGNTYYSTDTFNRENTKLATLPYLPQPNTRIIVGNDTIVPHIRIKLAQALADEIIGLNGQSQLSSNADWLAYFQGLKIESQPVSYPGAISYLDFFHSALSLYFHNATDTSVYSFSLTGARVNNFRHDFTGSRAGMQLNDPTSHDSINFIQSMAGLKTKITFPYLKHFLDSGSIAINRAELTISAGEVIVPYSLPGQLYIVTTTNDGTLIFPIDYFESTSYYGGGLNSASGEYKFNIGRQLQRYLTGEVDNADFYLVTSSSGVEATRAIIKSGSNLSGKMKLSIFYTKIN